MRAASLAGPFRSGDADGRSRAALALLPYPLRHALLRLLDASACRLEALGVSANAITATCIVLGALSGIFLAFGQFAASATAIVGASLGDALDGRVARKSGTASTAGALLDSVGDRYQEFFFLGGLAVFDRKSVPALVVTLGAIAGAFMVSYGSAKAEALGVPPPRGMRRPERALCLCFAVVLASPWSWWVHRSRLPTWSQGMPLFGAALFIAIAANVSAIVRFRALAAIDGPNSHARSPR